MDHKENTQPTQVEEHPGAVIDGLIFIIIGYSMIQLYLFYQQKLDSQVDRDVFFLPQFKSLLICLYFGILIQFPGKVYFAERILTKANADLSKEETMRSILLILEYLIVPCQIYEETLSTVQIVQRQTFLKIGTQLIQILISLGYYIGILALTF